MAAPFCLEQASAQGVTFIRDDLSDVGVEPNPNTGAMWVSPDIWVRNSPDPNYDPRPFPATGVAPWTPAAHENPEFDDSKTGFPAYVYVRVTNNSRQASTGTERLRVYWAKASTGLGWPNQWVDSFDTTCGPQELYGLELTKPRKNAAMATPAELEEYRDAVLTINSDPALQFSDGMQYWDKQNVIHDVGGALHGVPGFLPWHRELLNRYEVLLREAKPALTLLYWDWTTDPRVGNSLFTSGPGGFMGAASGNVAEPLLGLQPPTLERNVGFFGFAPESDATVVGRTAYASFRLGLENSPNHNDAHGFIGGPSGQISFLNTAAQDPFFFFLHGNVDRLWAQWQRAPGSFDRLDPVSAYGTNALHQSITSSMGPWNGLTGVAPWTTQAYTKAPPHPSVVSPPIYDVAPLVVPVLQPGQSVVMEIPWFPPNPAKFGCFPDPGHFCLLARIETSPSFPFGMTTPEGMNVEVNTRANNKIAWKNVTVVDNVAQLRFLLGGMVRNFLFHPQTFRFRIVEATEDRQRRLLDRARLQLIVPPGLFERWERTRRAAEGVVEVRKEGEQMAIALAGDGAFIDVTLEPGESFPIELGFDVDPSIMSDEIRRQPFGIDLQQILPGRGPFVPQTVVGGLRYVVDLSRFTLVPEGSEWRALKPGSEPSDDWTRPEFDDQKLPLVETPLEQAADGPRFFRLRFNVAQPEIFTDLRLRLTAADGAAVFLNGEEIARRNIGDGPLDRDTRAQQRIGALEGLVAWTSKLDPSRLLPGDNILAVALYQADDEKNDLRFDLTLTANEIERGLPPEIAIIEPATGDQFLANEPIRVSVQALDQDDALRGMRVLVDGARREVRDDDASSMRLDLDGLPEGVHTIEAEVIDASGAVSRDTVRINVVSMLPPLVAITEPANGSHFSAGEPIPVAAEVLAARSADIAKLTLFMRSGDFIPDGFSLVEDPKYDPVGEATQAPYGFTIPPLEPGMYMLQVGATDREGNVGTSPHVIIHVGG